jgi:hypothetical protein
MLCAINLDLSDQSSPTHCMVLQERRLQYSSHLHNTGVLILVSELQEHWFVCFRLKTCAIADSILRKTVPETYCDWLLPLIYWLLLEVVIDCHWANLQQQQHSLFPQASWGRLEMKPKRDEKQRDIKRDIKGARQKEVTVQARWLPVSKRSCP